jgi:hypothetical protein
MCPVVPRPSLQNNATKASALDQVTFEQSELILLFYPLIFGKPIKRFTHIVFKADMNL